ncbi:MAG: hypothetical protein ABIE22_02350 [archaeon]
MGERKLIRQGGGGFTIYLPKKWVNKKNLKEGDVVKVTETDTALIIGAEVKEKQEITLTLNDENRQDIYPLLTHVYRKGFNRIKIQGISASDLKKVKQIVNDLLLGFEITEIKKDYCKIENISEPSEGKYETILRKVFLLITETQDAIQEEFSKSKYDPKEIQELRNHSDKFILFCRRLLVKEKHEANITLEWELLTFLMHIQHAYYYLYKYAADNKIKIDKKTISYLDELKNYFEFYSDAYFNKNIKAIHKINNLKEKYQFGSCLASIEKSKGKNSVVYSYIRELFRLMQIGASPILSSIIHY